MDSTINQGQMSKGLWEVAKEGVGHRVDFFGVEPYVIGFGQKPLEQRTRLLGTAADQQRINQPEAADSHAS